MQAEPLSAIKLDASSREAGQDSGKMSCALIYQKGLNCTSKTSFETGSVFFFATRCAHKYKNYTVECLQWLWIL